ncbi:MAG: hypothetical protein EPN85_01135 [Bacteroidetes bacterium]|nr:MAG: hypothetical protein EPN85_01135 [Bacteroidota bacterium]
MAPQKLVFIGTPKSDQMKNIICIFLLIAAFKADAQKKGYKIYISGDMEGVTGVVTKEQLGPEGFEYEKFREIYTNEVIAAIKGARKAGASEIVISDSHGNGQNLLIDKLPKDVTIIRSWPRRFGMMGGIDETFDGVILLGYHTGTTNKEGVRAHTFSSAKLADVKVNSESFSEGAYSAMIAGNFNVPVIMVTGDDKVIEETKSYLGNVEGSVVKWAMSFESAKTLTPDSAYHLIEKTAAKAISRIKDFKPYKVNTPVTLEITFKNYRPSEMLAYLPQVTRPTSHSIRFIAKTIIELADFVTFVTGYSNDLEP